MKNNDTIQIETNLRIRNAKNRRDKMQIIWSDKTNLDFSPSKCLDLLLDIAMGKIPPLSKNSSISKEAESAAI